MTIEREPTGRSRAKEDIRLDELFRASGIRTLEDEEAFMKDVGVLQVCGMELNDAVITALEERAHQRSCKVTELAMGAQAMSELRPLGDSRIDSSSLN
jgi:hypothetical protein